MRRIVAYSVLIAAILLSVSSCLVENDMAYPKEFANIRSFSVEGQASATIDADAKTVNIVLTEAADIQNLTVTGLQLSEYASCSDISVGSIIDLSTPKRITVNLGEDQHYDWTISASQTIERYFRCEGQIGEADIRLEERKVYVEVADTRDIHSIVIESLKLEPEGSTFIGYEEIQRGQRTGTIVPVESLPLTLDCFYWNYLVVEHRGVQYTWGLFVALVDVSATISSVNGWARHIEVEAIFDGETDSPYFQYKLASADTWTDYTSTTVSGTSVTASIPGLQPETEYEVRFICGDTTSDPVSVTTEAEAVLHNMNFDSWYQDGKAWMPNLSSDYQVWDSANPGSATFNIVPTTPTDDVAVSGEGKQAVRMETMWAVVRLAAGNIYTGKFGSVNIAQGGATLDWGAPFTSRPKSLKGWYKYNPVAIDRAESAFSHLVGQPDTCQVQILLTDWSKPFTISTTEGIFVDIENDPGIIAHGKMEYSPANGSMSAYEEFEIELDYRSRTRKPTYVIISACASKYGDYFTGGVGSVLLVDEFEFVYE